MPEYALGQAILDAIEQAESVVIFRHVNPDPDALGSQLGLKEAILNRYPEKTVLALGQGEGMDEADDSLIAGSLAIITDTSNAARVDDARYSEARQIARIDHHVRVEDFGPLDLVDDKAAAACELEALVLRDAGWSLSEQAAQHLLEGLMADTQRFTIPTVSPRSFEAAAWLVEQGADANAAARHLFSTGYDTFCYATRIREHAVRRGGLLFSLMGQNDYLSAGLRYEDAKNHVNVLGSLVGIEIWALFTEQPDGHYAASLRSVSISVRELAARYGGGGHVCACGIKDLDSAALSSLIEDLTRLANPQQPEA